MIIDATIAQLRAYCPLLGGRVAGAADFRAGLQAYNADLQDAAGVRFPRAYVVPLGSDSDGNTAMTGVYQFVRKTIAVIVEFDARPDRRGQTPAMDTEAMEAGLHATLLNWLPAACITQNQQGFWLAGSRYLDLDRARLFFQWEYALNTILDDTDGWQPPSIPLEEIELDIYKAPPWAPLPPADGSPPAAIVKIDTEDATPIPETEDAE